MRRFRLFFWRRRPVVVLELHGTLAARVGALNIAAYGRLIEAAVGAVDAAPRRRPRLRHLLSQRRRPSGPRCCTIVHCWIGKVITAAR